MNLRRLSVRPISGKPSRAVGGAKYRQLERQSLWLLLEDREGHVGFGEASPLPGYSPDTLQACRQALETLPLERLDQHAFERSVEFPARLAAAHELLPRELPAARFALETALLDLESKREGCSPAELLNRSLSASVPVSALVDELGSSAVGQARAKQASGYGTLKLKLGGELDRELDTLRLVAGSVKAKLRVDANQRLSQADCSHLFPALIDLQVEFIEEPCVPSLWSALPTQRPPLALDESLQGLAASDLPALVERSGASVLVLKPMALGGFVECLRLADTARSLGLEVVVTHLFDGPIAHRAASLLALLVQRDALAAGLAPHAGLDIHPRMELALNGATLVPSAFRAGVCPEAISESV